MRRLPGVDETEKFEFATSPRQDAHSAPKLRKRDRDRVERPRLAGPPKPSLRDRVVALAQARGMVLTRDLAEIGVPRCNLARTCAEGLLIKVGYGRHRAAERTAACCDHGRKPSVGNQAAPQYHVWRQLRGRRRRPLLQSFARHGHGFGGSNLQAAYFQMSCLTVERKNWVNASPRLCCSQ